MTNDIKISTRISAAQPDEGRFLGVSWLELKP